LTVVMCGRLRQLQQSTGSRLAAASKKLLRRMVQESDHAEIAGVLMQTLSKDPDDRPAANDITVEVRMENLSICPLSTVDMNIHYHVLKCLPRFNIRMVYRIHVTPNLQRYMQVIRTPIGWACFVVCAPFAIEDSCEQFSRKRVAFRYIRLHVRAVYVCMHTYVHVCFCVAPS
jgi:hypothetical protein